jgi:choline dehydrogenase-like flavoprotein
LWRPWLKPKTFFFCCSGIFATFGDFEVRMNLIEQGKDNGYDAIVVGSGISGGWAAKELCEKGLKVLLLERGKPQNHPDYPTAALDPWKFPHCGRLTQEDKSKSHIQARHYSFREDNKHFYINDLEMLPME